MRGRVYAAKLAHVGAEKYYLVVSNNRRNDAFEQVLAVWLTTTPPRSSRSAMVQFGQGEIFTGWASCDDIETIWPDEVTRDLGAVTRHAMVSIEEGLRAALGM